MFKITSKELKFMDDLKVDYVIVDVRTPEEYQRSHIANAINFPMELITFFNIDKKKKIVVYCQSGQRSHKASVMLEQMGYDVFDLGSISNYVGALE